MCDELPMIWPREPHTRAKHDILARYLQAWFPILATQLRKISDRAPTGREILFVDGFAGPGEYEGGEPGSPIIALKTALEHSRRFPFPVRMLFIEKRADRFQHLNQVLGPYRTRMASEPNVAAVEIVCGDCDQILTEKLSEYQNHGLVFGSALVFLDQFGFGAVSIDLISKVLDFPSCEVFTYLSYKSLNRWISDPNKSTGISKAYGDERWRSALELRGRDRKRFLLEKYKESLHDIARAKYVVSFAMFDQTAQLLYWLFFCTNNLRGLEEMKKAMWRVDDSGRFRFSDRDDPKQLRLLKDEFDEAWLADHLTTELAGQSLSCAEIKEHVLVSTPCYLFKKALRRLEIDRSHGLHIVAAPSGRKPGTYPDRDLDKIIIEFTQPRLLK